MPISPWDRLAIERYTALEPQNTPAEAAASQPVAHDPATVQGVAYLLGRGNGEFSAPNYAVQGSQPQSENRLGNIQSSTPETLAATLASEFYPRAVEFVRESHRYFQGRHIPSTGSFPLGWLKFRLEAEDYRFRAALRITFTSRPGRLGLRDAGHTVEINREARDDSSNLLERILNTMEGIIAYSTGCSVTMAAYALLAARNSSIGNQPRRGEPIVSLHPASGRIETQDEDRVRRSRTGEVLWIDEAAGLGIHHSPFEQHEPPANQDLLDVRFPHAVDWSQYPMSVRRVTLHVLGNHLEGVLTRSYDRPTPDVGGEAACQSNQ